VLSLHVVANKTACFTVHNPTATTIRLAGNITMKTTRAAPRSSKKGPPSGTPAAATPAFCSKAALLKAGFPERVARRGYKTMNVAQTNSRSMLVEPAMRIFNTCVGAAHAASPSPP
jgi:4'-phosphopantetheinyl transferase EntD